jgi:hypothetical protein
MAGGETVRFRFLRDTAAAPRSDGSGCRFGLQDSKDNIQPPVTRADGMLVFDFELTVKQGPNPDRPVFTGPFASGPRDERFVYLSWQRLNGTGYMNRIKLRLEDLDWTTIHAAHGKILEADLSGRSTGGGRVPVAWRIAAD